MRGYVDSFIDYEKWNRRGIWMRKVTIQDIATELRLSRNTVTKALNHGAVAMETKREIIKKAKELGYSKLSKEHLELLYPKEEEVSMGSVLILFSRTTSTFWNKLLTGISDELNYHNYRMLLHNVDEDDLEGHETCKLIQADVKGIICLCKFTMTYIKGISKYSLPITFLDSPIDEEGYLSYGSIVAIEGKYAVRKIVTSILEKGYRKYAFIGHAANSINMRNRLDGMLAALEKYDITVDQRYIKITGSDDLFYCYSTIEQMIDDIPEIPEVFVCGNDDIVMYVHGVLLKKDLQLLKKTILVGFDNTIERHLLQGEVLTVEVKKEELGRRLVKTVIGKINHPQMDNAIITVSTYPLC